MMQKEKVDLVVSYEAYADNSKRRIKIRKCNIEEHEDDMFGGQRKIAQIKVIQKFLGKLKVEPKNYQAILNELDSLNMSKYIDEVSNIIASSLQEKQIPFYTEMATKLNSEYDDLPSILIKDLTKSFNQVFQAAEDGKGRTKTIFLFTVELFVCGFSFSYKEVIEMLKKVFKSGKSKRINHPSELEAKLFIYWFSSNIFTVFIANFSQIFTKRVPIWIDQWHQKGLEIFKLPEVLPAKAKQELTFFFTKYVNQCFNLLKQTIDRISEYENILLENLRMEGELCKETEKNYNEIVQKYVSTHKNLIQISQGINQPIEVEQLDIKIASVQEIMAKYINKAGNADIFQDQFQKEIYENIPNLIISEDKHAGEEAYKEFKPKLENCKNVTDCNELCKSFSAINNKKNRKMLMKDCLEYRKEYHLVTPYLCRMIAILNINYKDIGDWVNEVIFSEYEKIKETSLTTFVANDKKSRFLKQICEFTKFKVVDSEKTLNCIEHLIDNLNGYNIELIVSVLENVGRFLYLSETSANRFTFLMNKYENVIKKKSFPIFTTSQLVNSINLLKPRKEEEQTVAPAKSEHQKLADSAMDRCVIDELQQMVQDIDILMKTKEGFEAIKVAFLQKIEKFDFINSYNYAYLLDDINYKQLTAYVIEKTIQNICFCLMSRENQKTILWGKFLAELYKYKLLERSLLFTTIENLLKIKYNEIGVVNAICNILEACSGYLGSNKMSRNNQRFMLFVKFKNYISQCPYIPILEQFEILQIFDLFQPDLAELSIQNLNQFLALVGSKSKEQGRELHYGKQLDKFLSQRNLKKKEEKKSNKKDSREEKDSRKDSGSAAKGDSKQITNEESMQQMKAFDKEFNNIMETNRKDYSSRMAKPIFLEKVFDKKKEKKKEGSCITVIGRSGNKFIRKQISKGSSTAQE